MVSALKSQTIREFLQQLDQENLPYEPLTLFVSFPSEQYKSWRKGKLIHFIQKMVFRSNQLEQENFTNVFQHFNRRKIQRT